MSSYRLLKKEESSINDPFWNHYTHLVKTKVLPYQWEILNDRVPNSEPSHAIDNFKIAAGMQPGSFYGEVFQDSDVAKWLEAAGNILMEARDEELEANADLVIDLIGRAQEQDGYLDTYFTIEEPDKKWTNVLECHELYCAGHFIEGAVSYYRATGKEKVLQIALKLADHLDTVFGAEDGKLHGYPGHQEIEIALIKLYDLTQEERYLKLAGYFIDARGTNCFFEEEFEKRDNICFWNKAREEYPNRRYNQFPYQYYNQFHLPVREQKEAVGHAVRGVYMYTAMADLAARTGDKKLLQACQNLWDNIVERRMYITGGIGSTHSGEAFTVDYDLPNDTNYSETCASIGLMFFAQKMLKSRVHRTYGDTIERALYNTVLGGMNFDGDRFFYVNPLEVIPETCLGNTERNHVKPVRQKWFACACCPPNIARTLAGLWEYIYTADKDTVYVHLFIGGEASVELAGNKLTISQQTSYPWGDQIDFQVKGSHDQEAVLAIRIPEWSGTAKLLIDDIQQDFVLQENGYVYIRSNFYGGVSITLQLDMKVQLIQADQNVHYNAGRAALIRGPLVYCLEEADNGKYLNQIKIDPDVPFHEKASELWNGCVLLEGKGYRKINNDNPKRLYWPYQKMEEEVSVTAVPYFLWNNRTAGEMQVWMRVK